MCNYENTYCTRCGGYGHSQSNCPWIRHIEPTELDYIRMPGLKLALDIDRAGGFWAWLFGR